MSFCSFPLAIIISALSIGHLFPTNSLSAFWQTCVKLPLLDLSHWSKLSAAFLWVIWTTRNSFIFCATVSHSDTSILFSILHLYSFWIGSSVSGLVGGSRAGTLPPPVGTDGIDVPDSSRGPVGGSTRGDKDLLE
jgi:hypothetical protein